MRSIIHRICSWLAPTLAAFVLMPPSAHAALDCVAQLTPHPGPAMQSRVVTASDIASLRDIGQPNDNSAYQSRQFSVSRDQRTIAFLVRRADPSTNSYCQGLFVLGLGAGAKAKMVDSGGELIMGDIPDLRGRRVENGFPAEVLPIWAPDGRSLAYLRRDHGVTQVWHAAADGSRAEPLTHENEDVERFAWSKDGHSIILATSRPLAEWHEATLREGLRGYRFDERYVPAFGSIPLPPAHLGALYVTINLLTRDRAPATAEDKTLLEPFRKGEAPDGATGFVRGPNDTAAWLERSIPSNPRAPDRLIMRRGKGPSVPCMAAICQDAVIDFWWTDHGKALLFLALGPPGSGSLALFTWRGTGHVPIKLFETSDLLTGCAYLQQRLLCGRESGREPRRLVWVEPGTGRQTLIFNPNPEFDALKRGEVQRLRFTNDLGIKAFADLLLPPDHRRGEKHPLIIVQYLSRGFLRGGVGDEYPIHAFASRGYAVLSFNRPKHYADTVLDPTWTDQAEASAADTKGWADRRSVLSSLLEAIKLAEASGAIDPTRIGITGMSDGASSAIFALINAPIFSAAALSTCCEDPKTLLLAFGPSWLENRYKAGYPHYTDDAPLFWQPISLAMNAKALSTPLLLQLSSDEYIDAVETFASFKDEARLIDMYVFPNEHHVKYQPAHRLAVYERSLDWFDFWLRDLMDKDPSKAAQYRHWQDLAKARHGGP